MQGYHESFLCTSPSPSPWRTMATMTCRRWRWPRSTANMENRPTPSPSLSNPPFKNSKRTSTLLRTYFHAFRSSSSKVSNLLHCTKNFLFIYYCLEIFFNDLHNSLWTHIQRWVSMIFSPSLSSLLTMCFLYLGFYNVFIFLGSLWIIIIYCLVEEKQFFSWNPFNLFSFSTSYFQKIHKETFFSFFSVIFGRQNSVCVFPDLRNYWIIMHQCLEMSECIASLTLEHTFSSSHDHFLRICESSIYFVVTRFCCFSWYSKLLNHRPSVSECFVYSKEISSSQDHFSGICDRNLHYIFFPDFLSCWIIVHQCAEISEWFLYSTEK